MAGSSALTVTELTRDALGLRSDGIALSTANVYVDISDMDSSKLLFNVVRSGAAAVKLSFPAGSEYTGGDMADLDLATTADGNYYVRCPDSYRVKDANGYVNLTKSSASTGALTVYAILLP